VAPQFSEADIELIHARYRDAIERARATREAARETRWRRQTERERSHHLARAVASAQMSHAARIDGKRVW
jgi:L-amino acid N-acyltransferase YncA